MESIIKGNCIRITLTEAENNIVVIPSYQFK